MALVVANRVQETGTANTTVSFTLAGAVAGYQTFNASVGVPNTTYYAATDASGRWEVGLGTMMGTNLLTRTTILASSNSGSAVSTFSGTLNIFVTYPSAAGILETKSTIAASNIDLSTGNYFAKTISASTTFTVSNVPASGTAFSLILDLTNGGGYPITWWSGVVWAGGSAPILTPVGRDTLGFFTYDGGTTWTGLVLGKNVSLYSAWVTKNKSISSGSMFGNQGLLVAGTYYLPMTGSIVAASQNYTTWTSYTFGFGTAAFGLNYSSQLGVYVTCTSSGALYSSTDFVTWTSRVSGATSQLNFVAVGGASLNTFVVTASDGQIIYSTNGTTWTTASAAGVLATAFIGCIWANNQFVAVGAAGVIVTSPTGVTWTARTSGTANGLTGITWTGTRYVVVGAADTIVTSSDGITWTTRTSSTTSVDMYNVATASNGTTLIATGTFSTVLKSTDGGITWSFTTQGSSANSWRSCVWTGDRFLIGASSGLSGDIYYSFDGTTWYIGNSSRGSPTYTIGYKASNDTYMIGLFGTSLLSDAGGNQWKVISPADGTNIQVSATLYVSTLSSWIYSGSFGTLGVSTTDGATWTYPSTLFSGNITGLAWNGSNLAVACTITGQIATSPNLVTWTNYSYADTGYSVAYGNLLYVMPSYVTAGRISYSSTALSGSWTTVNTGTGQIMYGSCWTGSLWIVVGNAGTIATSPDAITWTLRTSNTSQALYGVSPQSSSIIYAGGANGVILKSVDGGVNWTVETIPTGFALNGFRGINATSGNRVVTGSISGSTNLGILVK